MSRSNDAPRRSNHVEMPVAYAAVGASAAADLMRFPPAECTPFEDEVKLGSGAERFVLAASLLMTWGAQRGAGYEISDVVRGDGGQYAGIAFDESGTPTPSSGEEEHFGPDGEPFVTAGTTASIRRSSKRRPISVLVVYTVDTERRVGFAVGNADDTGAVGEQLFTVEHRDDDTVWACVRGFVSVPHSGVLGVKGRTLVKEEIAAANAQLAALAPASLAASGLIRPERSTTTETDGDVGEQAAPADESSREG